MAHFTQDSRQYLVQEFIAGQNLAQALKVEKPYNEDQIRGLLKNLLPVLQFIHSHNVIHTSNLTYLNFDYTVATLHFTTITYIYISFVTTSIP